MNAGQKNEEDSNDLEYEDLEELEKRDRMIKERGPGYCHYTHRQQDMLENHCLGRHGLAMVTCKHCGAEGVSHNFDCEV